MNADVFITRALNAHAVGEPLLRKTTLFMAVWLAPILILLALCAVWLYTGPEALPVGIASASVALFARFGIVELMYLVYQRRRPSEEQGILPFFLSKNPSFPSGHATFYSALTMCLYLYNVPGIFLFGGFVVCMCLGRIAAGVHYPSDILAGFVVGMGTAWVGTAIIEIYW